MPEGRKDHSTELTQPWNPPKVGMLQFSSYPLIAKPTPLQTNVFCADPAQCIHLRWKSSQLYSQGSSRLNLVETTGIMPRSNTGCRVLLPWLAWSISMESPSGSGQTSSSKVRPPAHHVHYQTRVQRLRPFEHPQQPFAFRVPSTAGFANGLRSVFLMRQYRWDEH